MERAEAHWRERLVEPVTLPNGERIQVRLNDLYHAIADDRVLRHPERIEQALRSIYEIRQADEGRRLGLCRWEDERREYYASVIIERDNTLKMIHLIDAQRVRKYARSYEVVLWQQ